MKTVRLNGPTSSKMLAEQIDPRTWKEGIGGEREREKLLQTERINLRCDIMPVTTGRHRQRETQRSD